MSLGLVIFITLIGKQYNPSLENNDLWSFEKVHAAHNPVFTMNNPSLSTCEMASLLFVIITYRTMKFNAIIQATLNIRNLANQIVTFMIETTNDIKCEFERRNATCIILFEQLSV